MTSRYVTSVSYGRFLIKTEEDIIWTLRAAAGVSMTLDRVERQSRSASSSPSSSSRASFLHGVKKAVILLCPASDGDQSSASRATVVPGRAVRVQFATPTTASVDTAAAAHHQRASSVDNDRYMHCLSKKQDTLFFIVTLANVNRFSKFFHSHIRKKIL